MFNNAANRKKKKNDDISEFFLKLQKEERLKEHRERITHTYEYGDSARGMERKPVKELELLSADEARAKALKMAYKFATGDPDKISTSDNDS